LLQSLELRSWLTAEILGHLKVQHWQLHSSQAFLILLLVAASLRRGFVRELLLAMALKPRLLS
jgi:hypothetical protein